MKCLAIDTSTDFLSLGIASGTASWIFHESVGQQHAERALPEIARLLEAAQLQLSELDAIVFGQGPGSFTGLRIACGLAQGLAFAAGLPLIGIPTVDAVAQQAGARDKILVCLDARMQQVFCASYDGTRGERLGSIEVHSPEQVQLDGSGWFGAGSGFAAYPALAEHLGTALSSMDAALRPHAAAYLALAQTGRYPQVKAEQAELLYIRNKVALTSQEQRARRA